MPYSTSHFLDDSDRSVLESVAAELGMDVQDIRGHHFKLFGEVPMMVKANGAMSGLCVSTSRRLGGEYLQNLENAAIDLRMHGYETNMYDRPDSGLAFMTFVKGGTE